MPGWRRRCAASSAGRLQHTAEHGLSGGHHFYLTFTTGADGVELAPDLRAKYPDEMTIVLQHQFWDLTVENDRFGVTLKFRGQPARIVIPFAAISAFGDPSVNFGLQLKTIGGRDRGRLLAGCGERSRRGS